MFRSTEYQRGYDRGYIQALLDTLRNGRSDAPAPAPRISRKLGGPDAPYKQTEEWRKRFEPHPFG